MKQENNDFMKFLYNEELYFISDSEEKESEEPSEDVPGNQFSPEVLSYKTIVLTMYPDSEIPETDLELLSKILRAVNLSIDEVVSINLSASKAEENIFYRYEFNKCNLLAFLNNIPDIYSDTFRNEYYTIIPIDGNQFLLAPSLSGLHNNIEGKKSLWSRLKQLYELDN